MIEKDPEVGLVRQDDAPTTSQLSRVDVNAVDVEIIRPESEKAAAGRASQRVRDERLKGSGLISRESAPRDSDLMDPSTSRLTDALVVAALAASFAACVIYSAPIALTSFILGSGIMTVVDIVQHRAQGDQSSIVSRPGSLVKAVLTGVGLVTTVKFGVAGAAAAVAATVASEVVLNDDGSASSLVEGLKKAATELSSWMWVAILTVGAYVVRRYIAPRNGEVIRKSVFGRNYRTV